MTGPSTSKELSQLSTCWSLVGRAHTGPDAAMAAARLELLARYGGAVSRYLHGALRGSGEADELYQEFALRFLRGDFHRATPESGRFRDFLKTALVRLVSRHGCKRQAAPRPLEIDVADRALTAPEWAEQEFLRSWRAELLARTWEALQRLEAKSGSPFYQVLQLKVSHAELRTDQLADRLAAQLGRSLTLAGFRQTLCRARKAFADLLLQEVTQSLANPTPPEIETELADLRLLEYCRPALARQHGTQRARSRRGQTSSTEGTS